MLSTAPPEGKGGDLGWFKTRHDGEGVRGRGVQRQEGRHRRASQDPVRVPPDKSGRPEVKWTTWPGATGQILTQWQTLVKARSRPNPISLRQGHGRWQRPGSRTSPPWLKAPWRPGRPDPSISGHPPPTGPRPCPATFVHPLDELGKAMEIYSGGGGGPKSLTNPPRSSMSSYSVPWVHPGGQHALTDLQDLLRSQPQAPVFHRVFLQVIETVEVGRGGDHQVESVVRAAPGPASVPNRTGASFRSCQ